MGASQAKRREIREEDGRDVPPDRFHYLGVVRRGWLRRPETNDGRNDNWANKLSLCLLVVIVLCFVGVPLIITKVVPKHKCVPSSINNYTIALRKALLYFNAQKYAVHFRSKSNEHELCGRIWNLVSLSSSPPRASIPNDGVKYSCTGGLKWHDNPNPNPNIINGAMVGETNKFDKFHDVRGNYTYHRTNHGRKL